MVLSIYVHDIPSSIEKEDIQSLFCEFEGYRETRVKATSSDKRKIAFIDFESESQAKFAMETLQGHKFHPGDAGISIHFSENNKQGRLQDLIKPISSHNLLSRKRKLPSEANSDHESRRRSRQEEENKGFTEAKANNSNNDNIIELLSAISNPNLQGHEQDSSCGIINALQLISTLSNPTSSTQNSGLDLISSLISASSQKPSNNINPRFSQDFFKGEEKLRQFKDIPGNATSIVYVEGLPNDASEREVSHIFRPFPGFKNARVISREKDGIRSLICFADFENAYQSSVCINTIQGYRFDKDDVIGLHFSYGINRNNIK